MGTCAAHPDRPGTPCARCGTFGCDACLRPVRWDRLCERCVQAQLDALPRLEGRARAVTVALVADAVAIVVSNLALLASRSLDPEGPAPALAALTMVGALVLLATPPLYLWWMHLAVRRALAVGVPVGATPWEAVWSWCIPLVHLVKPFDIVRRLAPEAPVTWWQACAIVGFFSRAAPRYTTAPAVKVLPVVLLPVAALLAVRVVRRATARLATVPPREALSPPASSAPR